MPGSPRRGVALRPEGGLPAGRPGGSRARCHTRRALGTRCPLGTWTPRVPRAGRPLLLHRAPRSSLPTQCPSCCTASLLAIASPPCPSAELQATNYSKPRANRTKRPRRCAFSTPRRDNPVEFAAVSEQLGIVWAARYSEATQRRYPCTHGREGEAERPHQADDRDLSDHEGP